MLVEQYKALKINLPFHWCEDLFDMLCSDEDAFIYAISSFVAGCEFCKRVGLDRYTKNDVKMIKAHIVNADLQITERQKLRYQDMGLSSFTFDVPASLYDRLEIISKDIGFSINDLVISAVVESVGDYLYEVRQCYEIKKIADEEYDSDDLKNTNLIN